MRAIFSHSIEVRFRDCDPMGHVNNAVYLTYLEQARLAQWRSLWRSGRPGEISLVPANRAGAEVDPSGAAAGERGQGDVPSVILAKAEVEFRLPARYGDVLEIRIGLAAVGRTSFTYDYEIFDAQGRIVATARSVQVMYDYAAGRPVPIPDDVRRVFDTL